MKIEEYKVLNGNNTEAISSIVNEHISRGWVLHGNIVTVYDHINFHIWYTQAVVRQVFPS